MTTTVTVNAHCDPKTTKVRIISGEKNAPTRDDDGINFLLDGESHECVVHDNFYVSVDEVPL